VQDCAGAARRRHASLQQCELARAPDERGETRGQRRFEPISAAKA
jgi:hypothetical protein